MSVFLRVFGQDYNILNLVMLQDEISEPFQNQQTDRGRVFTPGMFSLTSSFSI